MSRQVIAFLTDFGTRDHYAGAMRGVVLDTCPDATLVDITHDIAPHDVLGGALELLASYRYFPSGTTFLVVVDPGVGTSRRGIAAAAAGYTFVGPDNGVLAPVLAELGSAKVVELTSCRYARATVSRTFEGRDRFAPAAAWLAKGVALTALGSGVTHWERLALPEVALKNGALEGEVIRVDRFGNLVTNISRQDFEQAAQGGSIELSAAGHVIAKVVTTYGEVEDGVVCALFGSAETLEVAVSGGSAAERLGLGRGAAVTIRRV